MADVGGNTVVRGRRIAIPEEGPIPGRTPISVPIMHPINAQRRFWREKAVTKPLRR
jgi:hypothetical protein